MKKNICCVWFFSLALMSCQATPKIVIYDPPTAESLGQIKTFVAGTPYTHIKLNCAILDFNLNVVAFLSKYGVCLFEPNGHSVIYNAEALTSYDQNLKVIWQRKLSIHHLIERSQLGPELLTLNSRYAKNKVYGSIRYDELLVLNDSGQTVKSFSFEEYFKKNPRALEGLPQHNGWTKDNHAGKTYEVNHGNSFSELTSEKAGIKTLTGYVFYCAKQQKIFILDPALKKIVKEFRSRQSLHTVRQYNEHTLIAYENANFANFDSSIQLINLADGKYTSLYEPKSPTLSSIACSSVQMLPDNKLFIVHSKCFPHPKREKDEEGYFLEFVDLKTKKSIAYHVDTGFVRQAGELINAAEYLRKNIGQ